VVYPSMEDFDDWLIGYRYRGRHYGPLDPTANPLVTRCPQHITNWALGVCLGGTGYSYRSAVKEAAERDAQRLSEHPEWGQNMPYVLVDVIESTFTLPLVEPDDLALEELEPDDNM